MYALKTIEAPFVHYQCGCKRQYAGEEMYICFTCNKTTCRFCIHEDEAVSYYCRFCLDVISEHEAQQGRKVCSRYCVCPICFSVILFKQKTN